MQKKKVVDTAKVLAIIFAFLFLIWLGLFFTKFSVKIDTYDLLYKINLINRKELKLHFIDVGQGDCAIIELPDGKNMLVDSGEKSESVLNKIETKANKLKIKKFDYGVLTHTDSDHSGNFSRLLDSFEFGVIYMPDTLYTFDIETEAYDDFLYSTESKGIQTEFSYEGKRIEGKGYKGNYIITFLSPFDRDYYKLIDGEITAEDKNGISAVLFIEYSGVSVLLTGDCIEDNEWRILDFAKADVYSANIERVDLLKVSHHGSASSSSYDFLSYTRPKNAIISVGENDYSHPSNKVLSRLDKLGTKVYTTMDRGDITFTIKSNPKNAFEINCEKKAKKESDNTTLSFNNCLI